VSNLEHHRQQHEQRYSVECKGNTGPAALAASHPRRLIATSIKTNAKTFEPIPHSSIGAELAGAELRLGLNHWRKAIETHSTNFPHADHDCADIGALTTARIRSYPDSDVLLASPECTNHSLAKGGRRIKPQAASLFEDGPSGDDEQERSRATMWDVPRFAEAKLLKGKPYQAIVLENVVDAYKWGADDDGGLFASWRMAMSNLGYESEIVWLNSMFAPPTPQSRDRMYVVFWRKGNRRPNLKVEPSSWCPSCERVVDGRQAWKRAPLDRERQARPARCPLAAMSLRARVCAVERGDREEQWRCLRRYLGLRRRSRSSSRSQR